MSGSGSARTLQTYQQLVLWTLRDARNTERLLENLIAWCDAFAEVARAPAGNDALKQLMRYITIVSKDLRFDDFRARMRQISPEAEATVMTIAEQMRREGREEGREEGELRGQAQLLLRQLTLRFGQMPADAAARVQGAGAAELNRLAERVLTASCLADVFT